MSKRSRVLLAALCGVVLGLIWVVSFEPGIRQAYASTAQVLYDAAARVAARTIVRVSLYGQNAAEADEAIAADGDGHLQVDVLSTTGTADVNVAEVAGTATAAGAGAVSAGTQRMTLASNDPAVVDLAALEVLATAIEADTTAIQASVQLIDDAIAGNEMQVDVVTSALPTGAATEVSVAAILADTATIDAQTLAIQTAVQIMDDWDETNRAAVNPIVGQIGVAGDAGEVSALTARTVEASPSARTYSAIDPDQVEVAADIAANAARISVTCQGVGTTAAMVRVGAATGGATGLVISGGTAANNGTGGVWSTRDQGAVFLYDLTGAGTADVQCVEETT